MLAAKLVHELLPERGAALFEQLGANAQRAARGPVRNPQLPSCANTGTSWIAGSGTLQPDESLESVGENIRGDSL